MTDERGNVAILMIAAIVLTGICCLGIARLGGAATQRARADTAADAAALAAADALAQGRPPAAARAAAQRIAAANGAVLETCQCAGRVAQVTVVLGDSSAEARAEVG
jgi:secretion/DNA translocation related TadE-like protein